MEPNSQFLDSRWGDTKNCVSVYALKTLQLLWIHIIWVFVVWTGWIPLASGDYRSWQWRCNTVLWRGLHWWLLGSDRCTLRQVKTTNCRITFLLQGRKIDLDIIIALLSYLFVNSCLAIEYNNLKHRLTLTTREIQRKQDILAVNRKIKKQWWVWRDTAFFSQTAGRKGSP